MALQMWLVEISEGDWDYDRFERAAVWAASAQQAEELVRAAVRFPAGSETWRTDDELWIESPEWGLDVSPAPTDGVVLVHWHAG